MDGHHFLRVYVFSSIVLLVQWMNVVIFPMQEDGLHMRRKKRALGRLSTRFDKLVGGLCDDGTSVQ